MMLRGDGGSVELICEEIVSPHLPTPGDIRLTVQVQSHGFKGVNHDVWIGADAYLRFLDALRELESTRRGEAAVDAMSPNEFHLSFRVVDRSGRIVVSGQLGRTVFCRFLHTIAFGFDFFPSLLAQAVRDFERLSSATQS